MRMIINCVFVANLCTVMTLGMGETHLMEEPDAVNATWSTFSERSHNGSAMVEYNPNELIQHFVGLYPVEEWTEAGYFTVEYLKIVNPHWLGFDPRPREQHYALAMIYAIIMFLGVTGNFLVIYLFSICKALRTPANILVINLACSDLLMMLKMPIFIFNSLHLGPALGDKICRLYGFVGGLSGTCSICTITAISLDRYYVVKYPLKNRFSSQRAKLCVTITWIYACSFAIVPLFDIGYGRYVPEGFLTSCSFDYLTHSSSARTFIWIFSVAAFILPITLIVYFYWSILRVVMRKSSVPGEQRLSERDSQRHMKADDKRKQELRVTAVVFSVIVVWILAWTPHAIVALLGVCGKGDVINPLGSMIPALFCKSASCCDPFIYALNHPKFKTELQNLCCKLRIIQRTAQSNYHPTLESSSALRDGLNHVESKRYWWNKSGFHMPRGFGQRRNSSITKPRIGEDGVEEVMMKNIREREECM